MKHWTPGQVAILWIAGLFAFLLSDDVIVWLYGQYGYSRAQLRGIMLWRLVGTGVGAVLLLGITWRWLGVRSK